MDDTDIMDVNEYMRLQKAIEERTKRVDELEKDRKHREESNFRYVLDYTFPFDGTNIPAPQTRSFVVKAGTRFIVKAFEGVYGLQGDGQRTFIDPLTRYLGFFRFNFLIRDTGTDRQWSDHPMPDQVLLSRYLNPHIFGAGHAQLDGGSEVSVDIIPTFSSSPANASPFTTITDHVLQVAFAGIQVNE